MLIVNPDVVRFEAVVWEDVGAVVVDRAASRVVEEWTDFGPHAGLVDAAEIRTTVRVVRRLLSGDAGAPVLGTLGELAFYTATGGSDAARRRVRVRCVLTSVKTELPGVDQARGQAMQTLSFIAASTDGATDPLVVEDEEEEETK